MANKPLEIELATGSSNIPSQQLVVNCHTPTQAPNATIEEVARAHEVTAASLHQVAAIAARYHISATCGNVRVPSLIVDGNTVPAIQDVLAKAEPIPNQYDPHTGEQRTRVNGVALGLATQMATMSIGDQHVQDGLSKAISEATGINQPRLPVRITPPRGR